MTTMQKYQLIEKADTLVDALPEDASLDLQSLAATYRAKRDADDTRGATAYARAIVRRAASEGVSVSGERSMDDLRAEIASRNEGREDADLIKPAGRKKADLEAALEADDAKSG